jgi:hypothetical protein
LTQRNHIKRFYSTNNIAFEIKELKNRSMVLIS